MVEINVYTNKDTKDFWLFQFTSKDDCRKSMGWALRLCLSNSLTNLNPSLQISQLMNVWKVWTFLCVSIACLRLKTFKDNFFNMKKKISIYKNSFMHFYVGHFEFLLVGLFLTHMISFWFLVKTYWVNFYKTFDFIYSSFILMIQK